MIFLFFSHKCLLTPDYFANNVSFAFHIFKQIEIIPFKVFYFSDRSHKSLRSQIISIQTLPLVNIPKGTIDILKYILL